MLLSVCTAQPPMVRYSLTRLRGLLRIRTSNFNVGLNECGINDCSGAAVAQGVQRVNLRGRWFDPLPLHSKEGLHIEVLNDYKRVNATCNLKHFESPIRLEKLYINTHVPYLSFICSLGHICRRARPKPRGLPPSVPPHLPPHVFLAADSGLICSRCSMHKDSFPSVWRAGHTPHLGCSVSGGVWLVILYSHHFLSC